MGTKRLRRSAELLNADTARMASCRTAQEFKAAFDPENAATLLRKLPHYPEA